MTLDSCPYCGIGKLHFAKRTHVRVYGDTLVHMPNIPTRTCDMCGQMYFSDALLRRFEVLIGEAGPPPNHHEPYSEPVGTTPASDGSDVLRNQAK